MLFSLKLDKGTVIKLPIPNREDPTQFTYRPAIVLREDADMLTVLVCPMTTQVEKAKRHYTYFIEILKSSDEGKRLNLDDDSVLMIERIVKVKKSTIKNFTQGGKASKALLEKINTLYLKFLEGKK
jgi:mRNA-degrading endonuclease toxin of MazEF toxin-antitoxin module